MNRRDALMTLTAGCAAFALPACAQEAASPPNLLAGARPGDIRLFVSNALRISLGVVQPQLETLLGHRLVPQFGESRGIQNEILAGQPFEAALLIAPIIDAMIAKGKIVPDSRVNLGAERVGVAIRGNPRVRDIANAQALKALLSGAARISRFAGEGASVLTADRLFGRLDADGALKEKIVVLNGTPRSSLQPPSSGQYEVTIDTGRVLTRMKGWDYLGLLPEEFQVPMVLAAGIGVAGDQAMAARLINFLRGRGFDKALGDNDITRS